jgi:predicted RNA-binding Zn-ribbon protein involved in translation (DUF1610 family)
VSESEESTIPCPRCGSPMIPGHLKDPVNVVTIESLCSLETSSLEAWICPECGHVELQATDPQDLAHRDISAEDLRGKRDEWDEWEENL